MLTAEAARKRYWRKTVLWVFGLLLIWFLSSLGCGVLWVDDLDKAYLKGTGIKLGFWFAQQGSILIFLVILAVFIRVMNSLDSELAQAIEEIKKSAETEKEGL